jgi:hypothetical protein
MNSTDIIKTSSKIFGLYFILQTISNLRDMFYYLTGTLISSGDNEGVFMILEGQVYMAVFNLAVGLTLIFKADWVTEKLNPQTTGDLKANLDKKDLVELAIIVISGITILYSVPEILYKLVHYTYFNDYNGNERQYFWTNENKSDIFYSIFKSVVGLFCLLNARNFAGRLQKIGDKDEKLGE